MDSSTAAFDPIAGLYHRLWFDWYLPAARPALETLLFSILPPTASLLDVCCGSGHVTRELVQRGYRVTGVDISANLIEIARAEIPQAEFQVQDARQLKLARQFDGALCTFDALNHILDFDGLCAAFKSTRGTLKSGAPFVFDMNMPEAFQSDLRQWAVDVNENSTSLIRGEYDDMQKLAQTHLIWFRRLNSGDCWTRSEGTVQERCYTEDEILTGLDMAGFQRVEVFTAASAGMTAELAHGRIFVRTSA